MTRLLFSAPPADWPVWRPHLARACAVRGLAVEIVDAADPATVDYVAYSPEGGLADFAPFTRLRVVLSLWVGVETIVGNDTIAVPLCRMVDPGLRAGMVEWVAGHVLRHHLGTDAHVLGQDGVWRHDVVPPLARDRRVGVVGLGELGLACALALKGLGFDVAGWSRRPKPDAPVPSHSGEAGLATLLARSEIIVLLLPATPATERLIDADRLASIRPGAVLINPGRGALIDDEALLAALDAGRLAHATLDVFREEPLPPSHRFWSHPRVTVTPHIASATRPESAADVVAENIRRGEAGLPFLHEVDRKHGY
ncbi:glyoxylate/hydroxypyruvate reductase A [Amaricoccus sp.]|uniref:2-hydroxyacid dehydrogenase n=1 Tax=Amaricoccus sp. TaxID=1872485 RepID=UPI001B6E6521|nr:glyoxylate/hydroxypyruvate reductase A [Amaricoccus sp.]MBP7243245.1 glyoxylate/hydroxypyruvate reductase A [Amaricoccus sp.]